MEKKLAELKTRLAEINDLNMAASLLGWDQSTYMPPGGARSARTAAGHAGKNLAGEIHRPGHRQTAR